MHTTPLVLLGIPSVSALVLDPDLLLLSLSPITPDNGTRHVETAQGPWHTSNVSGVPLVSLNKTHSTSTVNYQIAWTCSTLLGSGPYAASCEEAARHIAFIPRGASESQELKWGRREWPIVEDVALPQEVVSCKHPASVSRNKVSL